MSAVTIEQGQTQVASTMKRVASTLVRAEGVPEALWVSSVRWPHNKKPFETMVFSIPAETEVVLNSESGETEFTIDYDPHAVDRDHLGRYNRPNIPTERGAITNHNKAVFEATRVLANQTQLLR